MRVLVIGSGGREHAIVWKLTRSKRVKKLFCAPGNGGIASIAETAEIPADDMEGIARFVRDEKIDFTVVGPEGPLVAGIVDVLNRERRAVFGPSKELAQLEGSKVYAKELMRRFKVPTARFSVFTDVASAHRHLDTLSAPVVVKADGLCAGKGVSVSVTIQEAKDVVTRMLRDRVFQDAGSRILIEECLEGEEASIIVISDGENVAALASSQDHKRLGDDDKGPNTGGMGAYSPAPVVTEQIFEETLRKIIYPVITGLAREGRPYRGALYAGIMITEDGPKVLEFNARFGDPETQAILPRLKTDLFDLMERSAQGSLSKFPVVWDKRPCVSVVAASGGYPGVFEKGKTISGLDEAQAMKDVIVFHAGTRLIKDEKTGASRIVTNGGRVLNITALGANIKNAIDTCYRAAGKIWFEGIQYRKDIAHKALASHTAGAR